MRSSRLGDCRPRSRSLSIDGRWFVLALPKIRMHDMTRARDPLLLVTIIGGFVIHHWLIFTLFTFLCQKPDAWRVTYPKHYGVRHMRNWSGTFQLPFIIPSFVHGHESALLRNLPD